MLRLLVSLSKDGNLQVWKTRVILNPNRPPTQANFFEPAGDIIEWFQQKSIIRIHIVDLLN